MWSVIGHEREVSALARGLAQDRRSHAYLITGPAAIGKARLALDLAKALNCTGDAPPCGACRPCRLIETRNHPDVELVSVGGLCDTGDHDHSRDGSKDIKICQIRRLQRIIALRPFEGRVRVFVVDPADAMNIHTGDAFLKTLEEPPESVVLILVTADAASLPETIISRAREIALAPVALEIIERALAEHGASAERASLIARLAGGRIGWAMARAGDERLLDERASGLEQLDAVLSGSVVDRLTLASGLGGRFSSNRDKTFDLFDLWQSWWRDVLLIGEGCDHLVTNVDRLPQLRTAAEMVSSVEAVQAMQHVRACRRQLEDNANARLAIEALVLRLPRPAKREEATARRVIEKP